MPVQQPLWLTLAEVPPLPIGWRAMSTAEATEQLKPGKLYDQKTARPSGTVPILNQGAEGILGYHSEKPGVVATASAPIVTFANHTCAMRLVKHSFSTIQNIFPKIGKPGVCDTVYFYYAAQGRVRLSDYKGHHPIFRQAIIPVPPLPTQRRIASVLSAYDDLIENNTRRIAILEKMARRLYEEWFVQFRFPGHEEAEFVGELPEGWKHGSLVDLTCYINRGIPPKYDENAEGLVINQKCVRDQRLNLDPARRQCKSVPKDKLLRFGDILINSTGVGTLGRVAQVLEPLENCTTDSHVTIVRARPETDTDFLGLTLFRLQPHFEGQGVGSTGQTELSRGRIAETECVVPPQPLQKLFGETVRPLRTLGVKLLAKNANLRAQRDLLLPKLISGEIDVSSLPLPGTEDQAA